MPIYKKLHEGTRKVSPGAIHNYSVLAKCSVKEVIYDPASKIIRFEGIVMSSTRRGKYNISRNNRRNVWFIHKWRKCKFIWRNL